MKTTIKAGMFFAAKYNGNNGDLIVGEVKSVRRNGDVILINLLTGKRSTKSAAILLRRNKRISKAQAYALQAIYVKTGDRQTVRKVAVKMNAFNDAEPATSFRKMKKDVKLDPTSITILGEMSDVLERFSRLCAQLCQHLQELSRR